MVSRKGPLTSKLPPPSLQPDLRCFLLSLDRGLVPLLAPPLPARLLDQRIPPAHRAQNLGDLVAAAHREHRLLVNEAIARGGRVAEQGEGQVDGQREPRRVTLAMQTAGLAYLRNY